MAPDCKTAINAAPVRLRVSESPGEVRVRRHRDDVRLAVRRLERRELAVDERSRHIVAFAPGDPRTHLVRRGLQIDKAQRRPDPGPKTVAVGPAEGRTGDDRPSRAALLPQRRGDPVEPRPAIVVVERIAGAHLGARLSGMEIVAIDKIHAEEIGQRTAGGRLARAGDAHHHDGHGFGGVGRRGRLRHGPLTPLNSLAAPNGVAMLWTIAKFATRARSCGGADHPPHFSHERLAAALASGRRSRPDQHRQDPSGGRAHAGPFLGHDRPAAEAPGARDLRPDRQGARPGVRRPHHRRGKDRPRRSAVFRLHGRGDAARPQGGIPRGRRNPALRRPRARPRLHPPAPACAGPVGDDAAWRGDRRAAGPPPLSRRLDPVPRAAVDAELRGPTKIDPPAAAQRRRRLLRRRGLRHRRTDPAPSRRRGGGDGVA